MLVDICNSGITDQQIDYFQKIMDGGCEDEETFTFVSRVNQIN